MSYVHLVLFQLHDAHDTTDAIAAIEASRPASGLISWVVTESLDSRKGAVVVEHAVFEDERAFAAFRDSDSHRAVGEYMSAHADWLIGDYGV